MYWTLGAINTPGLLPKTLKVYEVMFSSISNGTELNLLPYILLEVKMGEGPSQCSILIDIYAVPESCYV